MSLETNELTVKEQMFADEYLINGRNGTRAYQSINPNSTIQTCRTEGSRFLAKPNVSAYIKSKTLKQLSALNLEANDVINRLISIAFGETHTRVSKQVDNQTGEVIKDITHENQFDNDNQLKALELLGKYLALWTDRVDHRLMSFNFTLTGDEDE